MRFIAAFEDSDYTCISFGEYEFSRNNLYGQYVVHFLEYLSWFNLTNMTFLHRDYNLSSNYGLCKMK